MNQLLSYSIKIKNEKEILVSEKKIKKGKPIALTNHDQIPFVLPNSWNWVILDDVCEYIQRGRGPKYVEKSEYLVISQKCIQWSGFDISRARYISLDSLSKYTEERFLKSGDLLWNSTGTGTVGRINLYNPETENSNIVVADSHITVVRLIKVNAEFICKYLSSPFVQEGFEGRASGTTNQIELNTSTVKLKLIPIPPLAEQKRIVAKVDQLIAICDKLEENMIASQRLSDKLINSIINIV